MHCPAEANGVSRECKNSDCLKTGVCIVVQMALIWEIIGDQSPIGLSVALDHDLGLLLPRKPKQRKNFLQQIIRSEKSGDN